MKVEPDSSAVRTALWPAMHVQIDAPPHVIEDEIALALAAPGDEWRDRPDMHPMGTLPYRAAIVARTRFVEEIDQPGPQAGKRQRLDALGYGVLAAKEFCSH